MFIKCQNISIFLSVALHNIPTCYQLSATTFGTVVFITVPKLLKLKSFGSSVKGYWDIQGLSFLQKCRWRFKSSGMLQCVHWCVVTGIYNCSPFIYRSSCPLGLLCHEMKAQQYLFTVNMVLHHRRHELSNLIHLHTTAPVVTKKVADEDSLKCKIKVYPCTGTEALYRMYGP